MSYTKAKAPSALKPMTDEEKQAQIVRFFQQKRESFAQGILFNLCQANKAGSAEEGNALVDTAVAMADHLIEQLYPMPKAEEENTNEE